MSYFVNPSVINSVWLSLLIYFVLSEGYTTFSTRTFAFLKGTVHIDILSTRRQDSCIGPKNKNYKNFTKTSYAGFVRSKMCCKLHLSSAVSMNGPQVINKTGTSEVGAISKTQKAQSFQNCKRGDPFNFLRIQFVARYLN